MIMQSGARPKLQKAEVKSCAMDRMEWGGRECKSETPDRAPRGGNQGQSTAVGGGRIRFRCDRVACRLCRQCLQAMENMA